METPGPLNLGSKTFSGNFIYAFPYYTASLDSIMVYICFNSHGIGKWALT